jgi:tetratricopeptide (TPR) repeat protein
MHRKRTTIVAFVILAIGLGGTVAASRLLDRMHDQIALQEVLYLPSAKTVKAISFGYTGLIADIYWTRAVQYYGRKQLADSMAYKLLPPLLDITTTLDPHLDIAYQFGGFFLSQNPPQGAGEPDKGIELVKRGIENNPTHWRLYYNLGFIYWLEKKDYKSAAETFAAGAKIPGAATWMKTMAGSMAQGGNELELARTLWTEILNDTKDSSIRANAQQRLASINSDEAVIQLQKRVDAYKEHFGQKPNSMRDLVTAGLLRAIPTDPAGNSYLIDSYGDVVVKDQKKLPFITKGLAHGTVPTLFYNKYVAQDQHKKWIEENKKKEEQKKASGEEERPTH